MSEIDKKKINKNYNCVKLDKFPSSGGIFPDNPLLKKLLKVLIIN